MRMMKAGKLGLWAYLLSHIVKVFTFSRYVLPSIFSQQFNIVPYHEEVSGHI